LADLGQGQTQAAEGEDVDRLRDRVADRLEVVPFGHERGVEDVSARLLVGTEAGDRVVDVWIAAQVVLGPGREREGEVERPRRLDRRGKPLDLLVELVETPCFAVVVLARAADAATPAARVIARAASSGAGP